MIPLYRIKYSGKSFGLANGWKKWIGEIQSLDNMNGVERKEAFEKEFTAWVQADPAAHRKYGNILDQYDEIYKSYVDYYLVNVYTSEVFGSSGAESAVTGRSIQEGCGDGDTEEPGAGEGASEAEGLCCRLFSATMTRMSQKAVCGSDGALRKEYRS